MANAVVTKTGNIIEVVSNDLNTHYSKISQNVVTGFWVALVNGKDCIDSNLEVTNKISCKPNEIDTIDGNTIDTAEQMYTQLKALL